MEDKYLSIITNFGCHYKCPYCIVKKNGIKVPATTIDGLDNLEEAIKGAGANIVSVSGGGDPLHNYTNHVAYYSKLHDILKRLNIPLEMHTSYLDSYYPVWDCKRVVYHLNSFEQLAAVHRFGDEIVRVVFVVEEKYSEADLNLIAGYCKGSDVIDELSFRQMVSENYEVSHHLEDVLIAGHGTKWHYIQQCDYNKYYVNGKIYEHFSSIRE